MSDLRHDGGLARTRRFRIAWIASWSIPALVQLALSMWFGTDGTHGSAELLFWIVVVAASLCVVAATWVIVRSMRSGEADLCAIGLFFYPASVLPLVHGITTPGVVVGDNTSTMTSVLLAIPVALAGTAPFALPARFRPAWFRRHWRGWAVTWAVATTALAAALLVDIDLLPAPTPRSGLTITVAAISLLGCVIYSCRHLRLARIAARPAPLAIAAGYGLVGSSALVWLSVTPYSAGFWSAHVLDIGGVFAATIGALAVYRTTPDVRRVLRPALVAGPGAALEVGLDRIVHRFVRDLETKDQITRDHVVRTADLAVRVATELRLPPEAIRHTGLVGILHDVGKLRVPDEILGKPGRLTAEEFEMIKRHPMHGWELLVTSPGLAPIANGVRAHHERVDGNGYPDRLAGDDIPVAARIVAACDAFDAMCNTRQYRQGMGVDKALAILSEHAGSQWDPVVVAAVIDVVRREPPTESTTTPLDQVGHSIDDDAVTAWRTGCDCLPEDLIPDELRIGV